MESTIDDCFTISDNAGILEEKRLTGYNRDDIMFFVDGSLAQLVEHLTLNQGVEGSNPSSRTKALFLVDIGSRGWCFSLCKSFLVTILRNVYNKYYYPINITTHILNILYFTILRSS